ncbi:MAG: alcohol dehydrogenase catalytic domain-containing protein [Clostridia bacterium]|nr:alcohol dehydrogenase catalytic domain-containing protein [Clostridia bacterium]
MKAWQLTKEYEFEQIKRSESISEGREVKVKVTKSMLSKDDITLYNGEDKPTYPLIPGRFAIGVIIETGDGSFGHEKNSRVYLDPITSCRKCYSCTIGQPKDCSNFQIAGRNAEGFLKDFAVIPHENIYQLPKSVSDNEALFIEYISLAISVIDKLQIQRGEHVAVIGGNLVGNILAQLIIYYQAVPIIIDDNDKNLEIAKRSGIYYTLKSDGKIEKEVSELTGGRMTPKVVYVTSCGINTEVALKVSRANATVAFVGFNYSNIRVNFAQAMQKQLNFYCITNGYGNAEASINLIANHAINMNNFVLSKANFSDTPKVFKTADQKLKNEQEIDNCVLDMFN